MDMTMKTVAFHHCFENEPKKACELDLTYGSFMALSHTVMSLWQANLLLTEELA
jgi:hypothetical protein